MAEQKYLNLNGLQYFVRKIDDKKADIESPEFTGTPKAITPPSDDNSTRLATTAYVRSVVPADTQEIQEAVKKVNKLNDTMYDKITSTTDPTIVQAQVGCAISAAGAYTTGSTCTGYTLMRYKVDPGNTVIIEGTTLDQKFMIWATSSSAGFGGLLRKGPVFNPVTESRDVYEVVEIEAQEGYLFVSKTETMTVKIAGEIVYGDITIIKNTTSKLQEESDAINFSYKSEVGKTGFDREANFAAMQFLERITPYFTVTDSAEGHFCYCMPDLHTRFDAIDWHKHIFINSYPGSLINTNEGGLNNKCRIAVSAGDILYGGGGVLTTRAEILAQLDEFLAKAKEWAPYGTYLMPAIGGHDFNNYSDARANHDNKKIGDNLSKRDQLLNLVLPAVNYARIGVKLHKSNGSLTSSDAASGGCYYAFVNSTSKDVFVILDECDHPNYITGTYNGETVKWQMTGINFDDKKFTAKELDGSATYTQIPFGDFEYVYSRYKNTSYSQNQLNFVKDVLTTYKNGYNFWFFNHSGLNNELTDNSGAKTAIKKMVKALVNRTTYSGSGDSAASDMPWSIDVDFTDATSNFVGVFRGHSHRCYVDDQGEYKEYTSDTPGVYSSSVSTNLNLFNSFSGDLFQFIPGAENQVKRFHFGRRYAGIDDAPTHEERIAALEEKIRELTE